MTIYAHSADHIVPGQGDLLTESKQRFPRIAVLLISMRLLHDILNVTLNSCFNYTMKVLFSVFHLRVGWSSTTKKSIFLNLLSNMVTSSSK